MDTSNATLQLRPADFELLKGLLEGVLESECRNATSRIMAELRDLLLNHTTKAPRKPRSASEDSLAVVYIIFVMSFFAVSLLGIILKYLRRERESSKMQRFYEEYLETKQPSLVVHYDRDGRRLYSQTSCDSSLARRDSEGSSATPLYSLATTPTATPMQSLPTTPTATPFTMPLSTPSVSLSTRPKTMSLTPPVTTSTTTPTGPSPSGPLEVSRDGRETSPSFQ